ncbi:MAG: non-ribosomal peptide synthetase [Candidatus Binatia bacterium]
MHEQSDLSLNSTAAEDLTARIAKLSPAKRALFEMRLKKESLSGFEEQTIPRRTINEPCPLSFSQQRLWFLNQLEPENPVYNQPKALRLRGPLSVQFLQRVLDQIVARHEVLRTNFVMVGEGPAQKVCDVRFPELPVIDLRTWSETDRDREADRLLVETTRRPFDLARDLMLRALLLRLGDEEHILLLVSHHIASDGWSTGILWHELARLYSAFTSGEPAPLPALPIQYSDYSVWQRNWLQGKILEAQLSYWRKQLKDLSTLELPTDRPRPHIQSYAGANQSFALSKDISQALKALSRRHGVTLFMTLLAAFQTLLSRYTEQENIIVGSPIAGRRRPEVEDLIGFFVNTLVLRTDLSGNPSFSQLLGRVREVAMGAYAHQDLPFEKLVEELQPERSLSYSPLFQVMFGLQNNPQQPIELPGLTVTPIRLQAGTAKFDLFLSMVEGVDSLRGSLEYNTDLFDGGTISRMLGHYQTLLEGIATGPDQPISDLRMLTEAEKEELLVRWNETQTDYAKDQCIQQLFEEQANQTPEAVAVIFGARQSTYRELNRRANQIAHYLRKLGVGPEVTVGLCVERSVEMVVGMLGILKAGGAYVPLDSSYPKERLAFMLQDAGIGVLLTQRRLVGELPEHNARVVCLDSHWEMIGRESEDSPASTAGPENLAYVIYTSGSTGKPKGVEVLHRGVVNFLSSMREQPGLSAQDILVAVTTLSFDIAGLELLLPLSVGARVVIVSREVAADAALLSEELTKFGCTLMQATPATWQMLLEAGWQGNSNLKILCGGETLTAELAAKLLDRCCSLWNLYGPTETTIWSAAHHVESVARVIPIGRPIDNTQIYILDPYLNPVPIGVPGELHIGGVGLARGYKDRPELVAEKFIPDPFSAAPGTRLYKTGDRARYLASGGIEFLGRVDDQVKVRGFRIELGEIEAVLRRSTSIRQAVVTAREDRARDRRLIAYVVLQDGKVAAGNDLTTFLRATLPEYMIPSGFVFLDELPLTANGKVDRRSLPAPDQASTSLEKNFVAPRDELELQLTKIWEKVLATRPVGVRDNFFDLGGHSLLAVRLFSQIEKTTGKHLGLAVLFQAPTIEQMAGVLRQHAWPAPWRSLVAIQPGGSNHPFFSVHAHEGNVLFYNDLARYLGPDQPVYGLQAQGLDGKQAPHARIEEMAAHYIKEIRTLQPEGPYFLGGYCLGGLLAFEIAQQFHAAGETVALLALIDTYAPGYIRSLPNRRSVLDRVHRLLRKFEVHVSNLLILGPKEKLRYIKARFMWLGYRFYTGAGFPSVHARARNAILKAMSEAARKYEPYVYPGRITLLRATKLPPGGSGDPQLGWEKLAGGGLEVHEIPGYFAHTLLEPRVRPVAEKLKACINRAQSMAAGATSDQWADEVRRRAPRSIEENVFHYLSP